MRHPSDPPDGRPRPINDEFATGAPNYKEFIWALVGLAGEGQNFDGNGMYVRFQTGGGSQQVSLGQTLDATPARCSATTSPCRSATGRTIPRKRPPYKPDVPCYTQQLPNVNGPASAKTPPSDVSRNRAGADRDAGADGPVTAAAGAAQAPAPVRLEVRGGVQVTAIRKH